MPSLTVKKLADILEALIDQSSFRSHRECAVSTLTSRVNNAFRELYPGTTKSISQSEVEEALSYLESEPVKKVFRIKTDIGDCFLQKPNPAKIMALPHNNHPA